MSTLKTYFLLGCMALAIPFGVSGQIAPGYDGELENLSKIKGPIKIVGTTQVEGTSKKIKDCVISLFEDPDGSKQNMVEIKRVVTPGNGKFTFELDINKMYTVRSERDGYTTKQIDFDTDVMMDNSGKTSVPQFNFIIDMVKDLDGLGYTGSVARVFYHIRKSALDYELDYTKEEQEEEERLARLEEERLRLAEEEAKRKFEREESAALLLKSEEAEAKEIIKAAATVGGDEEKVKKSLRKIYPQSDTLANAKVDVMYAELENEKKRAGGVTSNIDFKKVFDAAQKFGEERKQQAELAEQARKEELLRNKQASEKAKAEALAKQNAANQLLMKEKIAGAAKKAEMQKAKALEEKRQSYFTAIFSANGDPEVAIKNLEKAMPKGDPYRQAKAKAVYAEYENMRKTGATLSSMDFDRLFRAADQAVIDAQDNERAKRDNADSLRLAEFMAKSEAFKKAKEEKTVQKIEEAIKNNNGERAATIKALQEAFEKNDPYKEEKARAIYEQYVEDRKINSTGNNYSAIDFGSLFQVAQNAQTAAKEEKRSRHYADKQKAWEQLEEKRKAVREEKRALGARTEKEFAPERQKAIEKVRAKREKDLQSAIATSDGSRENTVEEIMKTLPKDAEFKREKAEAMYDAYRLQKTRVGAGSQGSIDYSGLFLAASEKEVEILEKEFEENRVEELAFQTKYETQRTVQAEAIAHAQMKKAELERQKAEEELIAITKKVEEDRRARLEQEKKDELALQRDQFEQQKNRERIEKEMLEVALSNEKEAADRKARELVSEQKRLDDERRRREAKAEAERQARLDELEKEKQKALDIQAKEERRLADEAAKKAAEEKAEADKLADAAAKAKAEKEEAAAKAQAEKDAAAAKVKAEKDAAAQAAADKAAKEAAEKQKIEDEYNGHIETAELAFEVGDYKASKAAYNRALKAKPSATEPTVKINQIIKMEEDIAKASAEEAAKTREYMLLLQDGNGLLAEKKYDEAKAKFVAAQAIKPGEAEPGRRIEEINEAQQLVADAAAAKAEKERLEAEEARKAAEAEAEKQRLAQEKFKAEQKLREEMIASGQTKPEPRPEPEPVPEGETELQRKYREAKERVEQLNLNAEEERLAFLSELAQIYPEGLTEENVQGKGYVLLRHVINEGGVVTVFEKRTWDWGGVFYFKDTDIAITEALYKLELREYKN